MFWPTYSLYWERVRTTSRSLDPRFITTLSWLSFTATSIVRDRPAEAIPWREAAFSQNLALIWRSVIRLHFSHMSATSILQFYIIPIIPGLYMFLDKDVYASMACVSSLSYPLSYGNNQLCGSCVQEIAELAVRNDLCRWAEYLLISHRLHRAAQPTLHTAAET